MKLCIKKRGFTIIELMVTLAIMAVLATIAAPLTKIVLQRQKEQELRLSLRQIREAIDAYKLAADDGRINKTHDQSGYPPNLKILEDGVEDIKDPRKRKIFFLRKIPRDPFTINMNQSPEVSWGVRNYQSTYDRPQAGIDVFDVYSLSKDTGLNGIPYKEW